MRRGALATVAVLTALLWFGVADSRAVTGVVKLETGDVLEGDVRFPPHDRLDLVLVDSEDSASIPVEDIKSVEVSSPPTDRSETLPFFKRLWRRLTGPSEQEQTLTVTLRDGDVFTGWFSWRQSAGKIEVQESDYIVREAYLRPKQIDRERHQPIDIRKRYVRSITLDHKDAVVLKECPTCNRSFEEPDYEYCPFDGTPLSERSVPAHE
jgi:hypothetical protein